MLPLQNDHRLLSLSKCSYELFDYPEMFSLFSFEINNHDIGTSMPFYPISSNIIYMLNSLANHARDARSNNCLFDYIKYHCSIIISLLT